MNKESLTLKWGTLKSCELNPEGPAMAALKRYHEHPVCASAMLQDDTPEQKQAVLDLIEALNAEKVYLDWHGGEVSKEQAKAYLTNYGSKK